jgi:glutathione peroxidase
MSSNFYEFKALSLQGKEISMEEYKGKVVLVVNTASKCGFTYQYAGLEKLYKKYKDQGFVVLGFPCNQFGGQEPGTEKEIAEGCVLNYGVTFQMFSKINVNGENAHPIYKYLKGKLKGLMGKDIKWNFAKFLIDSNGNPVQRYATSTKPEKLEKDIEKLLNKGMDKK